MRAKRTTTTDQTIEKTTVENRWDRVLIVIACFLLFSCSILTGINTWQGTERNKRIDRIDKIVDDVKAAAESADNTVRDAVAAGKTPEAKAQAAAIIIALAQIKEIENLVKLHIQAVQDSLKTKK